MRPELGLKFKCCFKRIEGTKMMFTYKVLLNSWKLLVRKDKTNLTKNDCIDAVSDTKRPLKPFSQLLFPFI